MKHRFGEWVLNLDPVATAGAFAATSATVNAGCCSTCAAFVLASVEDALPQSLRFLLRVAGCDLTKPAEVWGVGDDGFLSAWWHACGEIVAEPLNVADEGDAVDVGDGASIRITGQLALVPVAFRDLRLVQIELYWKSPVVSALEARAWPKPG